MPDIIQKSWFTSVNEQLSNRLPLSGGTIEGSIEFSKNGNVGYISCMENDATDYRYIVMASIDGSGFLAFKKDSPFNGGSFLCRSVSDNGDLYDLISDKNGHLSYRNQNIVRSVNGVNADENGNVSLSSGSVPVGTVLSVCADYCPSGYLVCNGAEISRTTYATLYSVIGNMYGSGDGSTTFNLPYLIDGKFTEFGGPVGSVLSAGVPNITGTVYPYIYINNEGYNGVFGLSPLGTCSVSGSSHGTAYLNFNARNVSTIYGNSSTVQPYAMLMLPIIKY